MSINVVVDEQVLSSVTPSSYGVGMDTNGVVSGGGAGGPVGSSAGFWSLVVRVLSGLDWGSMSLGVREGWLSALSNVDGAVAAGRAAALACSSGQVGAAERTAELVRATGMSGRDAAAQVKAADVLAGAPEVAEALASGVITTGHVDALMRDLDTGERQAAVTDPVVLAAAVSHGVDDFKDGMRSWQANHNGDLDGARLATRQHAKRSFTWTTTGDGMLRLGGYLPPEVGAKITGAIQTESERLWRDEDDRAPDPADPAVGRSVAQRNADALERIFAKANNGGSSGPPRVDLQIIVDHKMLAGRAAAVPAGADNDSAGTPVGQAAVTDNDEAGTPVGHGTDNSASGRCETADGAALTVAVVRRLACDAGVIPTVMGGDSQVLDQGRRTRTVSTAQRRALTARDGGCVFPGCDRPDSWCDAHHVIHWLNLGPTDLWNLVLLCSAHHRAVHEGGWRLTHGGKRTQATSRLVFTDPAGRKLQPEPPAARFKHTTNEPDPDGPPPTARHQQEPAQETRDGAHREGHVGGPTTADAPTSGNGHEHEQGQLVPARKQVVQRR